MTTVVRVVLVTMPDEASAATLARLLVEERLCACVNIVPGVRSIYRFEGKIEDAREVLLVIKTVAAGVGVLFKRLRSLHPYDVPEGLALVVDEGMQSYCEWVAEETTTPVFAVTSF